MLAFQPALLTCCLLGLAVSCPNLIAGDGYPPFGAWAYGSGTRLDGYSGYPAHLGYVGYRLPRYRGGIYGPTLRVYHPLALYRYRPCYRSWNWSHRWCPPSVSYAHYYVPFCAAAVEVVPGDYDYLAPDAWPIGYGESLDWGATPEAIDRTMQVRTSGSVEAQQEMSLDAQASDTEASVRLVASTIAASVAAAETIPESLLTAVDEIFRAAGYRPAAAAYAQLQLRFGPSKLIFGRRFVAQAASGDWDQAAVILASAHASGYRLERGDLPGGNLIGLFAGGQTQLSAVTERLASQALVAEDQLEAMQLMGTWLGLAGDDPRASLFLSMAQRLSVDGQADELSVLETSPETLPEGAAEELPVPHSKSDELTLE